MKIKLFLMLLIITFSINTVSAAIYKSDVETKRIPAGTKFRIQLQEPLGTKSNETGDYFSAILLDDQKAKSNVILPAGSIIRGCVAKVVKNRMLSRGAILYLDFDHIVTPNGRQLPLDMIVTGDVTALYDGGIYKNLGYGEAIQKNWDKTVDITVNSTEAGVDFGDDHMGGIGKVLSVPLCALGGALGGGFYFLGDTIVDVFRKGSQVQFDQGFILTVILTNPIDVPIN